MSNNKPVAAPVGIVFALFIIAPMAASQLRGCGPTTVWILCVGLGLITLWAAGRASTTGLLASETNRWSLARFQLVGWTVLILSTLWCFVVVRMAGNASPLEMVVDDNVWLLLGINAGSFAGASLVDKEQRRRATSSAAAGPQVVASSSARDFFIDNDGAVDISRVQMWFFTVVTLLAYCVAIWRVLASPAADLTFPKISGGVNTLLGISHATYLANKAAGLIPFPRPAAGTVEPPATPRHEPVAIAVAAVTAMSPHPLETTEHA